jgi:hypothetical protein
MIGATSDVVPGGPAADLLCLSSFRSWRNLLQRVVHVGRTQYVSGRQTDQTQGTRVQLIGVAGGARHGSSILAWLFSSNREV